MARIFDSILDTVGNTPLVRLSRIGRGLDCELLGKCEFLNAGGSVKDRIGVRMVSDAEAAGRIHPGDTLIEPTSGNTGIGICLAGAVKGYRVIITLPEKMSHEKQVVMEALGAEIIRTPTEAAWDSPESHISVAARLRDAVPRAHILDQYSNPSNPAAHREGTAEEILRDLDGELHTVVISAGTGGTVTGVAQRLKEAVPGVRIVGVDPVGSILAGPGEIKPYKVEGIGYDFLPAVLDTGLVDEWIKTEDRSSFLTARRLIRQEGLLVGGSSGAAVWAAMQAARGMQPGQRCVVILPDSIRNYLTKFADDKWMKDNHFMDAGWELGTVADVLRGLPQRTVVTVEADRTVAGAVGLMKDHGVSQLPVTEQGTLAGIVTESGLLAALVDGKAGMESLVAEVMRRRVASVAPHDSAAVLQGFFERGEAALVVENGRILSILSRIDLIDYLAKQDGLSGKAGVGA